MHCDAMALEPCSAQGARDTSRVGRCNGCWAGVGFPVAPVYADYDGRAWESRFPDAVDTYYGLCADVVAARYSAYVEGRHGTCCGEVARGCVVDGVDGDTRVLGRSGSCGRRRCRSAGGGDGVFCCGGCYTSVVRFADVSETITADSGACAIDGSTCVCGTVSDKSGCGGTVGYNAISNAASRVSGGRAGGGSASNNCGVDGGRSGDVGASGDTIRECMGGCAGGVCRSGCDATIGDGDNGRGATGGASDAVVSGADDATVVSSCSGGVVEGVRVGSSLGGDVGNSCGSSSVGPNTLRNRQKRVDRKNRKARRKAGEVVRKVGAVRCDTPLEMFDKSQALGFGSVGASQDRVPEWRRKGGSTVGVYTGAFGTF